jgi:hypothetical protein
MATRNERRKRAKAANLERTIRLAEISRAVENRKLMRANLSKPRERVYNYGPSSFAMVERNVGPHGNASTEIAAMLRHKAYTAK